MNCWDVKRIDIVDFLDTNGYKPKRKNEKEAWFISPLRPQEKEPSFRVNRNRNLWYDHGLGEGGDIIKLGCLLFNCTVKELLVKFDNQSFSFHQPKNSVYEENRIIVDSIEEISRPELVNYTKKRAIDLSIAKTYCKQINYRVGQSQYSSVGFINESGGWELRSESFKGATKKDISLVSNNSPHVCLFEGFFDTLSFIELYKETYHQYDLITLNSLSLLKKAIIMIKKYDVINLYLDNDKAGKLAAKKIIELDIGTTLNRSHLYFRDKDLNEFLMNSTYNSKMNTNPI